MKIEDYEGMCKESKKCFHCEYLIVNDSEVRCKLDWHKSLLIGEGELPLKWLYYKCPIKEEKEEENYG